MNYEYDPEAMHGIGGYCFGIHLEDYPEEDETNSADYLIEKFKGNENEEAA